MIGNTDGSNFVALENDSTIRGDEVFGSNIAHSVYASSKGMGGWYLKGSFTIWTATVTGVHYSTTCMYPEDCP